MISFQISVFVIPLLVAGCASVTCDEQERVVLNEFPQYNNASTRPDASFDTGACALYYQVGAGREALREYFTTQLTGHGWQMDASVGGGTLVAARRDGCSYVVYVETPPSEGGASTTNVAAHLSCD